MTPRALALLAAAALPCLAASLPTDPDGSALRPTAASILAAQPAEVVEHLEERRSVVLPEHDGGLPPDFVSALVIFEQPRPRVMRLLSQTARQPEFRPDLRRVETVARLEDGSVDEHRMQLVFVQLRYRLRNHFDFEGHRISWELEPDFDNDLRTVDGFWELYELDTDRTLGRFATRVDVGPSLPRWLQDYATRRNLPRTLESVRRWVDSDGTYRP